GNKSYIDKNGNNIIAIRPSYNFNDTIFVGWIDKYNIILSIIKRRLLFITLTAISILILIICSIRSSSIFLKPVSILKRALDEVSMGNLRISLENAPKDELGLLSKEFSKMIEDLREKERLSKLISDQAIQAIQKENNELLNKTETFKGVALVSDIRNFTGMSEKYDPTEITALLNEHFAEMTKIISDNGGQIYKFIGDAIEAVFPEKNELEKSASERAFNAGSMMISKLTEINKKRKIKDLFTYKIGIGLCYGTMYSGTIGSIETRLDYAILGEPLKKAAKYEALSIQNPSFPLVIGEDIAERIASLGYSLIKIKNNQKYAIYSLDNKYSTKNTELLRKEEKKPENTERKEKIKTFDNNIKSFSFSKSKFSEKQKILSLISFILIFFSLLILSGMIFVNYTINNNLKAESDKECSRLLEQLKSEEILKSSFETLCFDLYEDLDESFNSDINEIPFKQKIEKIFSKYERMGCPIPKYYCCKYNGKNLPEENICSKGFTSKTYTDMTNYASSVNNYRGFSDNAWDKKVIRRDLLRKFMGMDAREEIMRSIHYRRASIAMIDNEYMLIDTNKIFDKKQEKLLGFVLCGLPKNIENINLINYYTQISGKSLLLAIKNENNWYFSNNFPDNERKFLSEATDIN
ncbi:MAG: adenylate/guanylate cyclase domain-containing protein, partial [Candidatus Riflebacteria bacterium]|nr:adenylate/guanylate cyclase domain-containing protein [Candidatus Riflebacteria bacterium]